MTDVQAITPIPALLRAAIVDDERLARAKVRRFLEELGGFEVCAECANGVEALEILTSTSIDVLFLDVQMPEIHGFEVLQRLAELHRDEQTNDDAPEMPLVVFITAFDNYATAAFAENALDYLVKPFDMERFATTIERVRRTVAVEAAARRYKESVQNLAEQAMTAHIAYDERFIFRTRGKITLIQTDNVDWIEQQGNYAVFHVGSAEYILRETLSSLESRLNPILFIRIHRSVIVRLSFLAQVELSPDGSYEAVFRDSTRSGVGPTYRDAVRKALNLR
jgi:two-component system LytT family response regulator